VVRKSLAVCCFEGYLGEGIGQSGGAVGAAGDLKCLGTVVVGLDKWLNGLLEIVGCI
jgi:hypothetical protein